MVGVSAIALISLKLLYILGFLCPGQEYSKSARQLSRSFAAQRLTKSVAALDTKEAPTMLQIALEAM
jgi:hypothetical protein